MIDQDHGEFRLKTVGRWRWTKRVRNIIGILETVITYDTLYIGGGNAELIEPPLPANVKIVSNIGGITGGVRLWDGRMDHAVAEQPPLFAEQPA
jgi:polyphosphate glucokinase